MAEPAEARDHLVGREQDVVLIADRAHALPVANRRRETAAGVLHGLHVHEADGLGAHREDRLLEVVEQELRELLLGLGARAVVAICVVDVAHLGHERLERFAERGDAVDREGAHRRAVVGDVACDRLVPVRPAARRNKRVVPRLRLAERHADSLLAARDVVLPGELPRRLDGLGTTGDEEHAVQVTGCERGQLGGELDRLRMGVGPVGVEGQLAHLRERRLADLLAVAVPDVDREQTGEGVEVALAVRVPEVTAVALDDDRDVLAVAVAAHPGEVHPQVILGELLEVRFHGRLSSPTQRRGRAPDPGARACSRG